MKTFIVALPSGKQYTVPDERIILGRDPGSEMVVTDEHVSRTHCAIFKKNNMYYIEDLGSSNGTFVNGEKVEAPRKLYNNDTISLGQKTAAFQFRRDIFTMRQISQFLKKPVVFLPASAVLFAAAVLFIYFGFLGNLGKMDINRGLDRLRANHGEQAIPDDPEFRQALEKAIDTVKREYNDERLIQGMQKYRPLTERILKENNLSPDFSFIIWVESRFDANAYNRSSGAAGLWQLLPATARHYGIRVDRGVDQRFDPEASTKAASLFLKDLISIFGNDSLLLVLAAYNAGDSAIVFALKQIPNPVTDRNFWYLCRNNLIPDETKQYVLRILALILYYNSTAA